MSREHENFRTLCDVNYKEGIWGSPYPAVLRWVDEPQGIMCPKCGADCHLHPTGVTFICTECDYQRQRTKQDK